MDDEARLLALTHPARSLEGGGQQAIDEYLKRYPDRPPGTRDVALTAYSLRMASVVGALGRGEIEKIVWDSPVKLSHSLGPDEPLFLSNGVPSSLRVRSAERDKALNVLNSFRGVFDLVLNDLFEQAREEADGLMPGGVSQAMLQMVTIEEAYERAKGVYRQYQDQDYQGAVRGLEDLKQLNPNDPYFRNMLGASLEWIGQHLKALSEYLYAAHLDPGRADVTANLMRALTGLGMLAAAVDVERHFERVGEQAASPARDEVARWGRFCRVCSAIFPGSLLPADAFDAGAPDLLDELGYDDRPWLP